MHLSPLCEGVGRNFNPDAFDAKIQKPLWYDIVGHTCVIRNPKGVVGSFSMTPMPGCCGVVISHFASVAQEYRNMGVGEELLRLRIAAACSMKYGALLATVRDDNGTEKRLLEKLGWKCVGIFMNPRTSNVIQTYQLILTPVHD